MAFIEVEAEIRACLNTVEMTVDTADPKLKRMPNLDAVTNALVDDLNILFLIGRIKVRARKAQTNGCRLTSQLKQSNSVSFTRWLRSMG